MKIKEQLPIELVLLTSAPLLLILSFSLSWVTDATGWRGGVGSFLGRILRPLVLKHTCTPSAALSLGSDQAPRSVQTAPRMLVVLPPCQGHVCISAEFAQIPVRFRTSF